MNSKRFFSIALLLFAFWGNSQMFSQPQIRLAEDVLLIPLTPNSYIHKTYATHERFGRFSSNGLIVVNNGEALVFDTPMDSTSTQILIQGIQDSLGAKIVGVVVNHFHVDCLGGLSIFHQMGIPSYSSKKTQKLAKRDVYGVPQNGFRRELRLTVGEFTIINRYVGKGHSPDNIVSYVQEENILFGGCMLKSLKSGKGNLGDADVNKWPKTVAKVQSAFPDVKWVIPGHGSHGGPDLLAYTIKLFTDESE